MDYTPMLSNQAIDLQVRLQISDLSLVRADLLIQIALTKRNNPPGWHSPPARSVGRPARLRQQDQRTRPRCGWTPVASCLMPYGALESMLQTVTLVTVH
jgi:hypothetical protein